MDVVDEAQRLELDRREDVLAARHMAPTPRPSTGICCDCGDSIEPERLAALPTARRCFDCQALAERNAR